MNAYMDAPGYQAVALQGYLVQHRGDGTYIAPLIPQLFFGASGSQLQTWRQNLTTTGDQVVLSRSGGQPKVPREELWWRKVQGAEQPKVEKPVALAEAPNPWIVPAIVLGVGVALYAGYKLLK